jgi:hypothetical protein
MSGDSSSSISATIRNQTHDHQNFFRTMIDTVTPQNIELFLLNYPVDVTFEVPTAMFVRF